MCVHVSQEPFPSPRALKLPGTVMIRMTLSSSTRVQVQIRCTPDETLSGESHDQVIVGGSTSVSIPLHLDPIDGDGRGDHSVTVIVDDPECGESEFSVGVAGI